MFFDTHCHLNDERFANDIKGYIMRAQKEGINRLLVVAWDIASSKKAIALAEEFPHVYAAAGIHPVDAVKTPLAELTQLELLLTHPKVVSLGEIGLDYHWIKDPEERQIQHVFFKKQLELADQYNLPVIIHMRDATHDTYLVLNEHPPAHGGVMHSYSGSVEYVPAFLKLGMYIGLGGPVTYLNAKEPKSVAAIVPDDRLLIETDAPYLSPHPFRGRTNESARLLIIATKIAEIKNITVEELGVITTQNALRLFNIKNI